VRISGSIGVGVVPPVIGHPPDHRPLKGKRAGNTKCDLDSPLGTEASMGKQSVVSRRHPMTSYGVEDHGKNHVENGWPSAEQRNYGRNDANGRPKENEQGDRELRPSQRHVR
jgi:hypothetical protein